MQCLLQRRRLGYGFSSVGNRWGLAQVEWPIAIWEKNKNFSQRGQNMISPKKYVIFLHFFLNISLSRWNKWRQLTETPFKISVVPNHHCFFDAIFHESSSPRKYNVLPSASEPVVWGHRSSRKFAEEACFMPFYVPSADSRKHFIPPSYTYTKPGPTHSGWLLSFYTKAKF